MRIAVLSDIHGNLTAFEAVLADLHQTAPDVVVHGGDLADCGSSPAEVVDHIQSMGWPGVLGNTAEMLVRPDSLIEFAANRPAINAVIGPIQDMAAATRELLGTERLAWMQQLPRRFDFEVMTIVHASPENLWLAPGKTADDAEFKNNYRPLGQSIVVYGHTHEPCIRTLPSMMIVNAGSVELSHDGEPRASYLLVDGSEPTIRRVEYSVAEEITRRKGCGIPHAERITMILRAARPQLPPAI